MRVPEKMRFVAIVSGDNTKLGAEELKTLAGAKGYVLEGQIVVLEGDKFDYSRLAFTKKLYELLFVTNKKNLESDAKKFGWERHCSGSFRVDSHNLGLGLDYLGSLVWGGLKNPKVDLKSPKTRIGFLAGKDGVFVGKLLFENREKFSERRPHLRPGFHPSSLQPKLARALVNLADAPERGVIADPFCGTGGILIEAGLLGYRVIGSDLSEDMVGLCKKNFKHFGIRGKFTRADATKAEIMADAIVTDPPYGICAALYKSDKLGLYRRFLGNAYSNLKGGSRLVIMFPNRINERGKFKLVTEIDHYQHKSLTRHILVLEKS